MMTITSTQRGLTLTDMLLVGVVVVLLVIGGVKLIPHYIEDKTIHEQFVEIAHDPELKTATVAEIRNAFSRRASVSDISAIKAEDIDISKNGDGLSLSASYTVKVPLMGNASLLLEFSPSSSK